MVQKKGIVIVCNLDTRGEDIVFEATGAKGRMTLTDGQVRVEIDLSFLLRPLKGTVEPKTNQYLDEYIK